MNYVEPAAEYLDVDVAKEGAWFLVFIAVLMALGVTYFIGASLYCMVYRGGTFTGRMSWARTGVSMYVECK